MKDFKEYLKRIWWFYLIAAMVHFLWMEAYVYPTLSFDFSVVKNPFLWLKSFVAQLPLMVVFYFVMWRPNRKKIGNKKEVDES